MRVTLLALAGFLLCDVGHAAPCPSLEGQTLRWIIPTRPGGGYDAYSRLLQPFLEQSLDAQIVMENRPEAGGIVAAIMIRDAQPDGTTLGLINASGLLNANLLADSAAPDPARDFAVLGRVVSNRYVMFTGSSSGIADIDALLALAEERPIVAGVRDVGSVSFAALPVTASLLGFEYAVVTGYVGNADRAMAAIRGEVDVAMHTFDSARRFIDSGELVPLLQLAGEAVSADIPHLAELAVQRARHVGLSGEEARSRATALDHGIGAGRLIVAPPGLPGTLAECLSQNVHRVLSAPDFRAAADKARLTLTPADAQQVNRDLQIASRELRQFAPLVREAVAGLRD